MHKTVPAKRPGTIEPTRKVFINARCPLADATVTLLPQYWSTNVPYKSVRRNPAPRDKFTASVAMLPPWSRLTRRSSMGKCSAEYRLSDGRNNISQSRLRHVAQYAAIFARPRACAQGHRIFEG